MSRIDWAGTRSNEEMAGAGSRVFDWAPTFIDGIILIDAALASDEAPFAIAVPPAVVDAAVGSDDVAVAGVGAVAASDAAVASDDPGRVGIGAAAASDAAVASDEAERASVAGILPDDPRFSARRWAYRRSDV